MKIKKWMFWLIIFPLPIHIVVVLFILHLKPLSLIPTTRWQVEAGRHDGKPVSVKTYKMLGREAYFFRVDGGEENPLDSPALLTDVYKGRSMKWFVIDFPKIKRYAQDDEVRVSLMRPDISPYWCAAYGDYAVNIVGGKNMPETWWLSYTGDTVVFSNEVFFVSATQKNSGRKPVEVHRQSWSF